MVKHSSAHYYYYLKKKKEPDSTPIPDGSKINWTIGKFTQERLDKENMELKDKRTEDWLKTVKDSLK